MKTWEVIKTITENPKIVYENGLGQILWNNNGFLMLDCKGEQEHISLNGYFGYKEEWQIVVETVDFLTAYNDCLENGNSYIIKGNNDPLARIYKYNGDVMFFSIIHGLTISDKWYKED